MTSATQSQHPRRGSLPLILGFLLLTFASSFSARAQVPRIAGSGADFDISAGYQYINLSVPSTGRVNLSGLDATFTSNFTPQFGISGDVGYSRASQTLSYNVGSSVTSYLGGPVVYLKRKKDFTLYARALFGGARVSTVVPVQAGILSGYVERFAYAAGGGIEYRLSPRISFRFGVDYFHTQFAQSDATYQGQSDLRAVASVVYHFGSRER